MQSMNIENIRKTMINNIIQVRGPQQSMKDTTSIYPMNEIGPRVEYERIEIIKGFMRWPRVVLRTAAAYADQLNTDKYNSLTGLNTVIYRNFL